MDIVLPLINNVGLLALAALVYTATPGLNDGVSPFARSVILGLALGAASALVMLIPIQFAPGIIYDTRAGPLLMSGILGGPVTALVAAVPPILMRAWIGGVGSTTGMLAIPIFSLCSVAAWYVLKRRRFQYPFLCLLAYAAAASALSLPIIFLLPDRELAVTILINFSPVVIAAGVAGVAVLGLLISVDARRRAMVTSLRASEAAALDALEIRKRFIAMMSHEVRTPLNAIIGYAQILRGDAPDQSRAEQVDRLSVAAKSLLRMIDDTLHASKILGEPEQAEIEPWSLPKLVNDALGEFRTEAALKSIDLRTDPAGIPNQIVMVDGHRLSRCLVNVLSNAVKFTDKGQVTVGASIGTAGQGTMLRLTVSDTGIGMDADQLGRIFEPFERIGVSSASGSGLGMAIVQAGVNAMEGTVGVVSEPRAGTTVTIEIPTATRGPAEDPAPTVDTEIDYVPAKAEPNILVVDDIEINADIAQALLERIGCRTGVAVNGADAVEALRNGTYDAVLMDIEMPVMDGLQATRVLRGSETDEPARSVPIIALTAYASRDDMSACLEAGMNGYLAKPVDKEALYDALVRVGVLQARPSERPRSAAPAATAGKKREPVFSQERFDSLTKLVPAETLAMVLQQAAIEIRTLGDRIADPATDQETKRQALHKLVSIAGNIGLIHLSSLSRHYQETIRTGTPFVEEDSTVVAAAIEQALSKLAEFQSTEREPT